MELVSIIIPVYNAEKYITKCVESILNQTYTNIEIILVDDGSKDDSYLVCKNLAKKDKRITVIHTDNKGAGSARNIGIERATGDYAYFPDSDDFIEPSTIEILVNEINNLNSDLLVFGYKNINRNDKVIFEKKYDRVSFDGNFIRNNYYEYYYKNGKYTIQGAPWNKFFDLKVIKDNNIRYPNLKRHQDEGFIARYISFTKRVSFIPDILYYYYVNDLKKEWDKFPIDYFDNVNQLYCERKQNILIWNVKDYKTHDLVYKEYICNIIKSLELSFSPKYNLNSKNRKKWILDKIETIEFDNISDDVGLRFYHWLSWQLIKKKKIKLIHFLLGLKVEIEKRI